MPSVLVTGAARGIGRSIAKHLAATGWDVIAGVRTEENGAAIRAADPRRISSVLLDVTDSEHIAALDDSLPDRLDAVVNNAGVMVCGPIETVSPAELRRPFEVNVVGQLAVTQAVLPRLRRSQGRIVFISSVGGRISVPLAGPYSASKFAIEAAADALRMELRPWRIAVVVIEPAQTDTDMLRTAEALADDAAAAMSSEQRSLYGRHLIGLKKSILMSRRLAGAPENVAAVVAEALTARRPRARYLVGAVPKLQVAAVTVLPASVRDSLLRKGSRQPGHR